MMAEKMKEILKDFVTGLLLAAIAFSAMGFIAALAMLAAAHIEIFLVASALVGLWLTGKAYRM